VVFDWPSDVAYAMSVLAGDGAYQGCTYANSMMDAFRHRGRTTAISGERAVSSADTRSIAPTIGLPASVRSLKPGRTVPTIDNR
jgi:hypothetical protein